MRRIEIWRDDELMEILNFEDPAHDRAMIETAVRRVCVGRHGIGLFRIEVLASCGDGVWAPCMDLRPFSWPAGLFGASSRPASRRTR